MERELIEDAVLVSNYIKGDENALEILIARHKQKIYSFIYSKVFDRDPKHSVELPKTFYLDVALWSPKIA